MSSQSGTPKSAKQAERDQRRAAALRENLHRRKSQARARAAATGGAGRTDPRRGQPRHGPVESPESEP